MAPINRVLDPQPVETLAAHVQLGGGSGLDAARQLEGVDVIGEIEASGLRGRGGAGFPTGTKWRSIAAGTSADTGEGRAPVVVVNAAEGEPGSFKDRTLLRTNPYRVLEGALIAADAIGATEVIVALKQAFLREHRRLALAIAEMADAGWLRDADVRIVTGPGDYLFGEETALLEVIEGRQPFPRIAPPYRRGIADPAVADVQDATDTSDTSDTSDASDTSDTGLADSGLVLANNVETLANVPDIVVRGAEWFRSVGTADSPGTIVCTVSGDSRRAGVREFPMGTPLGEIIETIGGGAVDDNRIVAAVSGVSNAIVPADLFGTPASHEGMESIGSGLGAAGFIVVDDRTDIVAFAHAISRFLAVESCGQCEPCKSDGLAVATELDAVRRSSARPGAEERLRDRLTTIVDGARCTLAEQHRAVVTSVLDHASDAVGGHVDASLPDAAAVLVAPIVDIVDGLATLDSAQADKLPDWSYGASDSGSWPAAHLGDTPVAVRLWSRTPGAVDTARRVADGADGAELTDADDRPIPVDVAGQLELAHHELVDALLATKAPRLDEGARGRRVERFANLLDAHMEVTTQVLLPWIRRAAGDAGEELAARADDLDRAAQNLVAALRSSPADPQLHDLARDLHAAIIDEERRIVPLLENHLDDGSLTDVGRAMHEARLQGTGSPRAASAPDQ